MLEAVWICTGQKTLYLSASGPSSPRAWRDGDGSTWRSRKLTTNRILRGNTRGLVKCPVLAYVLDSENLRLEFMFLIFCARSLLHLFYGFLVCFPLNIGLKMARLKTIIASVLRGKLYEN